jgi:NAD(P)-dependent dehydrogenase (short-subunit alcohol dehydrogenase family)
MMGSESFPLLGVSYPDLDGRIAIVTGATGGVGREVCSLLVRQGTRVVATDTSEDRLRELQADLEGQGTVEWVTADLRQPEACESIYARVATVGDGVDLLINNAAMFASQTLEQLTAAGFDAVMAVNARAPILLARLVVPSMIERGGGSIVNVASVAVRTGGATDVLSYTASKGALVAATKSIAKAVARYRIRVNAVLPAAIDTDMLHRGFSKQEIEEITTQVPLGRLSSPREIAAAIGWLCSNESSYVTGASIDVNGGWAMA